MIVRDAIDTHRYFRVRGCSNIWNLCGSVMIWIMLHA